MNAGRQIDGSLTLDGTTYLVELKFTASQANATDIDSLRSKVDDKADIDLLAGPVQSHAPSGRDMSYPRQMRPVWRLLAAVRP